jgi:hypothetical protein
MTQEQILAEINAELGRLQKIRSLLSAAVPVYRKTHKRKLSAQGLANIRAGVRKRWAKA